MTHTSDVLIKAVITEKSMDYAGKGKFTFVVRKEADKGKIKKAVEEKFGVNVVSVATVTVKGRTKRTGRRRIESVETAWKKAIVGLKEGQKIDIFTLGS